MDNARIPAMHPEFGIFEPVFESAHGYLALLGLSSGDATEAVKFVRNCCGKVSKPSSDICRLLAESNWRPHLVAAVAMIVSGFDAEAASLLWRRLDCGSWVTPQIAAALFLVDPDFPAQARARLEARCPVDTTELRSMSPIERHSATGPAGTVHRSAKAAAALLQLAGMASPIPPWVQEIRAAKDMQALLAQDIDGSDKIAERWLNRIREITAETD
jgi:hypothetical protein